jgi:2-keto-4-pentenoate hydratase/2-oxohepta-3-ene-1,7-dioic acid hydratase in catechol pathway
MATQYRLLTFKGNRGKPTPGILVDKTVVDLTKIRKAPVDTTSTLTLLEKWSAANGWMKKVAAEVAAGKHKAACKPLSRTSLLPPIMYPGSIFCIASNYVAHRAEMGNTAPMPDKAVNAPVFFLKTPRQVVVGEGAKIHLPRTSTAIDWESEVAVVIGKPAFWVKKEDAFKYVAGFTILNDMSVRGPTAAEAKTPQDHAFRRDRFRRKNWDGSTPMGPWITPRQYIKDIYNQPIQLWLNGEQMQNGNSGDMWYKIEEQIAYLSQHLTLAPGDVITTGTPAGVGKGRGIFLKAGDKIVTTIGELGTLKTSFVKPK